jgi:membrane-associated phospholipid phosphatase
MTVWDVVSISVVFLYATPIAFYLKTNKLAHIKAFVGLLGTVFISETLKNVFVGKASVRPSGAKNCNVWNDDGNQAGRPGMPSSHSAGAVFFSTFYYQTTSNVYIKIILVIYALAVMLSRIIKQCHTVGQVIAGGLLGFGMSWLFVRHL